MPHNTLPDPMLDAGVVDAADRTVRRAINGLLTGTSRPRGVVVTAPAGAGKSHLVSTAVDRARDRSLRVAVAAPITEQAFGLVRTLANLHSGKGGGQSVTFVPARDVTLPEAVRRLPGVREMEASRARGEALVVGTLSKLGDAFTRGTLAA